MDSAHEYTDDKIDAVEKQIDRVYASLQKDIDKLAKQYFSQFEDADAQKLAEVKAGSITENEHRLWRASEMMSGRKWSAFVKKVCKLIYEANKKAVSISNMAMTDVFIENYNFVGKDIERQVHALR